MSIVAAVASGVSESLPVELNGESVYAVDTPESFTAGGPFHLELSNAGGAVHVHVRPDEELSAAVRLRAVNHYVETGETVRVPAASRETAAFTGLSAVAVVLTVGELGVALVVATVVAVGGWLLLR